MTKHSPPPFSFLRGALIILSILLLTGTASATTYTVQISGGSNDQNAINSAISSASSGDTVSLNSGTYTISAPIKFNSKSGVILKGAGMTSTIIQISSYDAFLGSAFSPVDYYRSYIMLDSSSNIEMYGFNLKGAYPTEIHRLMQPETWADTHWSSKYKGGDDSENAIFLEGSCDNDKIHDIKFNLVSDNAIKSYDTSNLQVYNCDFRDPNHDCLEMMSPSGMKVYNNYMDLAEDCGIRMVGGSNCNISFNTFVGTGNHENGAVYFEKTASGAIVSYNIIRDLHEVTISAIYTTPWHADSGDVGTGDVTVIHNVFYNNVGRALIDAVNPCYRTNYANNPNFFLPYMTVTPTPTGQTIPDNLFPTSVADWTSQGYGIRRSNVATETIAVAAPQPSVLKINDLKADVATETIAVAAPQPLVLKINDLKADVTSGYEPLKVHFTSDVSGSPTKWTWKFEKWVTQSFKVGTATHTFMNGGIYDVTLTVRDATGHTDTMTKPTYITVRRVKPPIADFSAKQISDKHQLKVQFTDKSRNNPTKWLWTFGDRTTSKDKNPLHHYNRPGRYTVSLTVTNAGGFDKTVKNMVVHH